MHELELYISNNPTTPVKDIAKMFSVSEVTVRRRFHKLGVPFTNIVKKEELDGEEWKTLDSPFDIYEISNYGRVRNAKTGHFKKLSKNERGYWVVDFEVAGGARSKTRVHRLIARHFIFNPDPSNKTEVNHKDGDTSNLDISNLEWCSKKENMDHAWENSLLASVKISKEKAEELCIALTRRKADGKSLRVVAEEHQVPLTLVERISARKTWLRISKKYIW